MQFDNKMSSFGILENLVWKWGSWRHNTKKIFFLENDIICLDDEVTNKLYDLNVNQGRILPNKSTLEKFKKKWANIF